MFTMTNKSILSPLIAKSHCKSPLLRPLQRPWISRDLCHEGKSNMFTSKIHYFLLLATTWLPFSSFLHKICHYQSSTDCTLVANIILYLKLHLLYILIITKKKVLECIGNHWNIQKKGLFLQLAAFWRAVCCVSWGIDNLLSVGSYCKIL